MESANLERPRAINPESTREQFMALVEIIRLLRIHCPWDRRQTNRSIAWMTIEEAYEMADAVLKEDDREFSRELGDLLLHVIIHSIIAEQRGAFELIDVITQIQDKLVYRHPHVFGNTDVEGEEEVLRNWEDLKMKEGQKSILQGVPKALPALLRAERIQHKASKTGFDWDKKEDVWDKVDEEYSELKEELKSGNKEKAFEEFGDFVFSLVNAARFEDIVPEEALQATNNKFTKRFRYIETKASENGLKLKDMTLAEMDKLWDEAKELE